jgi:hypothetical protein
MTGASAGSRRSQGGSSRRLVSGFILALCAILTAVPTAAQVRPVEPGARVRITAPELDLTRAIATIVGSTNDSLFVELRSVRLAPLCDTCPARSNARNVPASMARSDIEYIDVSVATRSRGLRGLGLGVLSGAGFGALIGYSTWQDPETRIRTSAVICWFDCTAAQNAMFHALGFGLLGGLAGLLIGSAVHTDVWEPAAAQSHRLSVWPALSSQTAGIRGRLLVGTDGEWRR